MIYVFLANGFEEMEAIAPIDILRRAGGNVTTVGIGGRVAKGAHGITVSADVADTEVRPSDDCEAVILPGGMPGTLNLERSDTVRAFLKYAYDNGRVIGAICAAPSVLGHMKLLQGKKATCYTGFEKELTGAVVQKGAAVVVDGNIITARGAGVAVEFGLKTAEILFGADKAEKIGSGMLCAR